MEESQDKYLESIKREQEKRAKQAKQKIKEPKAKKERPEPLVQMPSAPQKQKEELFIPGPAIKSIKGIKTPTKTQTKSTEDAIFNANKYDFFLPSSIRAWRN